MTVLVTGSSGFVGRRIVEKLIADGKTVAGLDPAPSPATRILDDLSDRPRLRDLIARERITHIIHAGGISGPMVLTDDPAGIIAINVTGSLNLLNEAMAAGVVANLRCHACVSFSARGGKNGNRRPRAGAGSCLERSMT